VGHVKIAAPAIGLLSVVLVAGLGLLKITGRVDVMVSRLSTNGDADAFPKSLPDWVVWFFVFVFAFGIPLAILNVAGTWRRLMIWVSALVVIAGWAPVLALAALAPEIGAPWIATFWSGVCALIYAGNHRMPCDGPDQPPPNHSK
jgi:hypothetical protein